MTARACAAIWVCLLLATASARAESNGGEAGGPSRGGWAEGNSPSVRGPAPGAPIGDNHHSAHGGPAQGNGLSPHGLTDGLVAGGSGPPAHGLTDGLVAGGSGPPAHGPTHALMAGGSGPPVRRTAPQGAPEGTYGSPRHASAQRAPTAHGPPAQGGPGVPRPTPPGPASPSLAKPLFPALATEAPGSDGVFHIPPTATAVGAGELLYEGQRGSTVAVSPRPAQTTPPPVPLQPAGGISTSQTASPDRGVLTLGRASARAQVSPAGVGLPRGRDAAHWFAADAPDVDRGARHVDPSLGGTTSRQPAKPPPRGTGGVLSAASAGAAAATLLGLACGLALLALGLSSRLRLMSDEWHTILYLALPERPG